MNKTANRALLAASLVIVTAGGCSLVNTFRDYENTDTRGPLGSPCDNVSACESNLCVDGVCCAAECGVCETCNLAGSAGSCSPVPVGKSDVDECGPVDCDGTGMCCAGDPVCSHGEVVSLRRFGGGEDDPTDGVAEDQDGNIILVGETRGTINFGTGSLEADGFTNLVIAKFDPTGMPLFSRLIGGNTRANDVAIDSEGNIIVVGAFEGQANFGPGFDLMSASTVDTNLFIAKLDPLGGTLWALSAGDTFGQTASSIAIDKAGGIYIAGRFEGTLPLGGFSRTSAGRWDYFLTKVTPSGSVEWLQRIGDDSEQLGIKIALNATETKLWVAGNYQGAPNISGSLPQSVGSSDAFAAVFELNGNADFAVSFNGPSGETINALAPLSDGGVVVSGHFTETVTLGPSTAASLGGTDAFVVALTANGTVAWHRVFGDADSQLGGVLANLGDDTVVFAGSDTGAMDMGLGPLPPAVGIDLFAARLSTDGSTLWSQRFGGTGTAFLYGISAGFVTDPQVLSAPQSVHLLGEFSETFGANNLLETSAGKKDMFLLRLGL